MASVPIIGSSGYVEVDGIRVPIKGFTISAMQEPFSPSDRHVIRYRPQKVEVEVELEGGVMADLTSKKWVSQPDDRVRAEHLDINIGDALAVHDERIFDDPRFPQELEKAAEMLRRNAWSGVFEAHPDLIAVSRPHQADE